MSDLESKLSEYFKNNKSIVLAFLFGSAAKGRQIAESDVDIAVWFKNNYTMKDIDKIWLEVEKAIKRNIDLIILNQARPTIAWEAMRGKKLSIKNYGLYIKKMLEVSSEAEDFNNFILDFWKLRRKLRGEIA
ncbi:MAG: putative nucleotidyltransferase [Candidatus Saganbacteria bacterium]|uniref:Putative nucleotidyltransferase n=1 Tax=Candidatus Saganbacteria bacterium TaxID=2575572 RepID=A0A833NX45_UNCSA|nr:MAG: putative nucleotidyltransferase [Candidatus Saganbacteria bacterium]